ncbi:type II toxin-antitoxin system RelE/ParE family toxin [Inhella gelatinilytica]|uniref:Type II toxin-antitoxin system RelE/ParE family toxin n=1 Tax=Inhella gelatinilytica TaxID=2795030 RepID=A0A931IU47_9BURK|nr:type II toxin-antitoxin system RelE/ParE family toxin [Inhella gelatinilytica]MBH9551997.1 type II toxin-antitoxin system RelE/ParE family toxin [Inhella gelatinilytica]
MTRATRVELAPEILEDLDRIFDHVAGYDPTAAEPRVAFILEGLRILTHSPEIGRPVQDGQRELVIGRGANGYVARYRYLPEVDVAVVLAVRSQRELGYRR